MTRTIRPWPRLMVLGTLALAGLSHAQDTPQVEQCSRKLGVLAVTEPQQGWGYLSAYGLGSPAALLRGMVQQSGCFDVVERGIAMQNMQQERALAAGGDLRAESNVGKGQMQAADFVMTPAVQIASSTTGGIGGALLGTLGGTLGAIAGGLKFKEAMTSLLIADVRSSIQVASAEGKATRTDFGLGGWAGAVAGGGYTSTPEGKMVAAGFLDNYNRIVRQIRDNPQLIRTSSAPGDANAAASTRAEGPQAAGQLLVAKIANVKVFDQPSRDAKVVATLSKTDELIASGEVKSGFIYVDSANFSGWVQRTLVGPGSGAAAVPAAPPAPLPLTPGGAVGTAAFAGTYSGVFGGAENGSFLVTVAPGGQISGSGQSSTTGAFSVSGRVDGSGRATMSTSGQAGSAVFTGVFSPGRGTVTGQWNYAGRPQGGQFSGQRQ